MRRILGEREWRLTRSLGQNFLHDGHQIERILRAAGLRPGDRVLEIGPGLGPLTGGVLGVDAHVLAIEKDGRLVGFLRERFQNHSRLEVIHADALAHLRTVQRDWSGWKLVSNLPYSVASPLLIELAMSGRGPDSMTVTVQAEVAGRLGAHPGGKDYGVLSLLVQAGYSPGPAFRIPRECFFPVPGVDSACLRLDRRSASVVPAGQLEMFARIVKRGFSQRRKMMFKLLKSDWPAERLSAAFRATGITTDTRAEKVSLEQFAALTLALTSSFPRQPNPS